MFIVRIVGDELVWVVSVAFMNVRKDIHMGNTSSEKWVIIRKSADFEAIGRQFHISPFLARIMRNREVIGDENIRQYLHGTMKDLHNPRAMKDMEKAVSIMISKIKEGKKIRVIGDYDIDGICSTFILFSGLKRCGADVDYEIPHRMRDGYGLNEELLKDAYEAGIDTVITCDNGIAASPQIAYGKELGLTIVVTDHHEVPYKLLENGEKEYVIPPADAVVDSKQVDCLYPFKELCGAAVAWKFVQVLYEEMGIPVVEVEDLMEFAAIATIGDVMELQGENRILVKEGLKRIGNTKNIGLKALIEVKELNPKELSSYHIGFVIGPCMNASGRLDTAKRCLELFQCSDYPKAVKIATELSTLNEERKQLTQEGVEEAIRQVEETEIGKDKVLVVYLPDCHESIAGIIAGRIRERYYKPVFVITNAEDGLKGSGRSIEGFSMFEELCKCQELFTKFGGHPLAAGLSLLPENLEPFRRAINRNTTLKEEDMVEKVGIDIDLPLEYVSENLVNELSLLEPFGKGNEKPIFADKNMAIAGARRIGKEKNMLKLTLVKESGVRMEAMYFKDADSLLDLITEKYGEAAVTDMLNGRANPVRIMAVYYPSVNEYMGRRTLQVVLQGVKVQ